jgi:hypothetical protein
MQSVLSDGQAGAAPAQGPRDGVIAYPAQGDPDAAFVDAVRQIEGYAAGDPSAFIRLIWPLWRDTSTLVVARHALAACSRDFSWTYEAYSTEVAKRIAGTFESFAELELEFDRGQFARDVAMAAPPGGSLHHAILGFLIDPGELGLLEDIILRTAEVADEDGLRHLVALYRSKLKDDRDLDGLFGKLHAAGQRLSPECLGILCDVPLHDGPGSSAPFGAALSAAIVPSGEGHAVPAHFFDHAKRSRSAVGTMRPRRRKTGQASAAPAWLLETLASRLSSLARPVGRPRATVAHEPSGSRLPSVSGTVSWLSFNLERSEWMTVGPQAFRTDYGKRDSEGAIFSTTHRVGQALVYGPYVALQPGFYEAVFLGQMEGKAAAEFAIGVHSKAKTYARKTGTASSGADSEGVLCRLSFRLRDSVDLLEFVIKPTSRVGAIWSRGVRLRRVAPG